MLHKAHASGVVFHSIVSSNSIWKSTDTLLHLQQIKVEKGPSRGENLNVLWDGRSSLSFITFQKAKKLRGQKVRLQIVKIEIKEFDSCRYQLFLTDKDGESVNVEVLGIDSISTDIAEVKLDRVTHLFNKVKLSELNRPKEGKIDCLIGYEYAAFHPVRKQACGHLLILENRFGYVIGGSHPRLKENTRKLVHATVHFASASVEDFYIMENLGVECTPKCGSCRCGYCHPGGKNISLKDEREYNLIKSNLTYLPEKERWLASYPWICDPSKLPDNKPAAFAKLKVMEKRLLSNSEHADLYRCQMDDMVKRGVARKLSDEEIQSYDGPIHYIAHHAVLKPDSKSTPCCIVFNSTANYHGHVLNEYYAKGPDMLNNFLSY